MNHEHEHSHGSSPQGATTRDDAAEPGRSTRTAFLRKLDNASASGLIQRKGGSPSGSGAHAPSSDEVMSRLGAGSSLPAVTQAQMSDHLGGEFGDVKIHTDGSAAVLCKEMNAKAFTIGNDVAFGDGQYRPGTPEGDGLIAHELTHTIQQKQGRTTQLSGLGGDPGSREALEQEADRNAMKIQRKAESGDGSGPLEGEANAAGAKVAGASKTKGKEPNNKDDPDNKKHLSAGGGKLKATLVGTSGQKPPPGPPANKDRDVQRKSIQLDGSSPTDVVDSVVNTAKAAWDIIKDNRPQQTVGTKFCNAVPQNVPWNELYGWHTYSQTWHVAQDTSLGTNLLNAHFTITFQWGGKTSKAAGWFLNNYTIYANDCDVGWGWTINVNAGVSGDAFNSGTKDFPIGSIPLLMTTTYSSMLTSSSETAKYTASGAGGLQVA